MIYVLLTTDGTVKQYPYTVTDLRFDMPDVSFPIFPSDEDLALFNVYPVEETGQPAYNNITENLQNTIEKVGSKWVQTWKITEATSEEINQRETQIKIGNKQNAQLLLQQTDWVEFPSVSDTTRTPHLVNFEEFMAYRMALRAIAVNPSVVVEFPTTPQETWSN